MARRTSLKGRKGKNQGLACRTWTDDERRVIKALAIARIPNQKIAKAVRTDTETLLKYFSDIIDEERLKFDAVVMGKMAQAINEGSVPMMIFYAKANWGWRDVSTVEHSGTVGFTIQPVLNVGVTIPETDTAKLSATPEAE